MKSVLFVIDSVIRGAAYVAGILILVTTVMTTYEVVARSFLNNPTTWATELSIYAIIGSCFLGAPYGIRTYAHVTVDLLINNINERLKTIFIYLTNALGLIFSIVFTLYSYFRTMDTYHAGTTSSSMLKLPMYLPQSLLIIGGVLMAFAFILQFFDGGLREGSDSL